MFLTQVDETVEAIVTESGEKLFELIGAGEKLGNTRQQSLALSLIPPGKYSAAHHHRVSTEILYILQGAGELEVDGEKLEVTAGNVIMLEPGEVHSLFNTQANDDLKLLAMTTPAWSESDAFPAG